MAAFRQMGVEIEQATPTDLEIHGVGLHGLQHPAVDIDLGNSGTAMRLLAGVIAGQQFAATLTGDESLTERPMQRIITPLSQMGAVIESQDGKPPLTIRGNEDLRSIAYELPMASAQVKSAILLAGLYAEGKTTVSEPAPTRDHTERLLRVMGVKIDATNDRIAIFDRGRVTAVLDVELAAAGTEIVDGTGESSAGTSPRRRGTLVRPHRHGRPAVAPRLPDHHSG